MDLSILIPARNEVFLAKTVSDILEHREGETEVIVIADGAWPEPVLPDHPRVHLVYHGEAVGQRAGTNEAARLSNAKFIMKVDAHCSFEQGFDVKLMKDCEYDWTVVPRMYNLHAFDWKCRGCGLRVYQSPVPEKCSECSSTGLEKEMVWLPRLRHRSDFMRFDMNMKFQYWRKYEKRKEAKKEIADQMCALGACWMMHRDRYWELGGLDEGHGSWGQMGVEVACKSWLSGGRQVVNKKTWFAHMFRTNTGFTFPYPISHQQQERARKYSRNIWLNDLWPKATRKLSWLLDKFSPVPDWHEEVSK